MTTTQRFEVIAVGLGTKEDRHKYQLHGLDNCYRADLQRVDPSKGANPLDFIPMHFQIVAREHPMIGDTYTLTFSKDAKE